MRHSSLSEWYYLETKRSASRSPTRDNEPVEWPYFLDEDGKRHRFQEAQDPYDFELNESDPSGLEELREWESQLYPHRQPHSIPPPESHGSAGSSGSETVDEQALRGPTEMDGYGRRFPPFETQDPYPIDESQHEVTSSLRSETEQRMASTHPPHSIFSETGIAARRDAPPRDLFA